MNGKFSFNIYVPLDHSKLSLKINCPTNQCNVFDLFFCLQLCPTVQELS